MNKRPIVLEIECNVYSHVNNIHEQISCKKYIKSISMLMSIYREYKIINFDIFRKSFLIKIALKMEVFENTFIIFYLLYSRKRLKKKLFLFFQNTHNFILNIFIDPIHIDTSQLTTGSTD